MDDETVLITGCSSGIGRATAEFFAEEGWTVYATSRDESDLTALADLGCHTATLDVTAAADVERVVDRVIDECGHLDCLVNNAGYGQYGPLEDIPAGELHRQFNVNVYGPHRLSRAVLPHMREAGDGTIVNVSSIFGRIVTPGSGAYSGSKFALEAMSDAMRGEVADFGVDVVLVEPATIATQFIDRVQDEVQEGLDYREDVYGWLYELIEDASIVGGSSPFAAEPVDVAAVIHEAAETTDPHARYPVGRGASLVMLSRFLPEDVRDLGARLVRKLA